MSPKRKVTLYFNSGMLAETQREAIRQDRSVSWIIQAAWKIARDDVRRLPGVGAVPSPAPTGAANEPVHSASGAQAASARRTARE
jgi:uncharacterized small protein (TIGR04563 family)